jgi:CBS domain-containing protein
MQRADVEQLAVVDAGGRYAGVVTLADVLSVEEWLAAPPE